MDDEDRELFARSVEHAVVAAGGGSLDAALAELGWLDALADDARTAVSVLFELQGRAGATSGSLDAVLCAALGAAPGAAVVLPPLGRTDPPGSAGAGAVRGLATCAARDARVLLVPLGDRVVEVEAGALAVRSIAGLDPWLGLVEVSGTVDPSAATPAAAPWDDVVAAGQRALAHELVGASRTMLEQARTHALDRVQFDRPIASFQAVRHRLAEALVAVEGAAALADAAWDDGSPLLAAAAKAVAGRNAKVVAKHAQQVLAGIGFTTEHPLHRAVRRTMVLDRLLGDSRSLTRAMGEQLLGSRALPPPLPL